MRTTVDVTADGATTTCDADCSPVFDFGTVIHLDALPDTGQYLVGWSGDCTADGDGGCDLTIEVDAAVAAEYSPSDMPVTLTTDGNGSGTALWSPVVDETCQVDCTAIYQYGDTVTITADPDLGSHVASWSGDCVVDPDVPDTSVALAKLSFAGWSCASLIASLRLSSAPRRAVSSRWARLRA